MAAFVRVAKQLGGLAARQAATGASTSARQGAQVVERGAQQQSRGFAAGKTSACPPFMQMT